MKLHLCKPLNLLMVNVKSSDFLGVCPSVHRFGVDDSGSQLINNIVIKQIVDSYCLFYLNQRPSYIPIIATFL